MLDQLKRYTDLCNDVEGIKAISLYDKVTVHADKCSDEELCSIILWMKSQGATIADSIESYSDMYEDTGHHWYQTRWVSLCLGFTFKSEVPVKKQFCLDLIEAQ